ncbi:hypothetical protein BDA96_10G293900 [Sorghum bicolor]|uniref:Uncharacterized protein n=2 Tax=Sorghum bicolor TaxID=4558 RepID=A0A194YKV8_SORBI|nr:uncharacterized protein LOC110430741 [Sorghum bicolor]KAG0515618.1 hypothetical protein BDA96_10G293900 [Sorghum bicolor]KXG20610.1 hypothetical protein SORBI_3010G226500 [Sorghum bicolor]|eukprot:XP_021304303.1 uncharacterized protein LOC110430741 [Sorghum bicolor]
MADRAEAAAAAGDRERLQNIFLDAARVLMLFGAVATVGTTSADPMEAFVGLLLWMLGVCLLSLVPAAGRFPRAALAAAAMAITILKHLFALQN